MHSKSTGLFWSVKNIHSILSGTDKDRRGRNNSTSVVPRDGRAEPVLFLVPDYIIYGVQAHILHPLGLNRVEYAYI